MDKVDRFLHVPPTPPPFKGKKPPEKTNRLAFLWDKIVKPFTVKQIKPSQVVHVSRAAAPPPIEEKSVGTEFDRLTKLYKPAKEKSMLTTLSKVFNSYAVQNALNNLYIFLGTKKQMFDPHLDHLRNMVVAHKMVESNVDSYVAKQPPIVPEPLNYYTAFLDLLGNDYREEDGGPNIGFVQNIVDPHLNALAKSGTKSDQLNHLLRDRDALLVFGPAIENNELAKTYAENQNNPLVLPAIASAVKLFAQTPVGREKAEQNLMMLFQKLSPQDKDALLKFLELQLKDSPDPNIKELYHLIEFDIAFDLDKKCGEMLSKIASQYKNQSYAAIHKELLEQFQYPNATRIFEAVLSRGVAESILRFAQENKTHYPNFSNAMEKPALEALAKGDQLSAHSQTQAAFDPIIDKYIARIKFNPDAIDSIFTDVSHTERGVALRTLAYLYLNLDPPSKVALMRKAEERFPASFIADLKENVEVMKAIEERVGAICTEKPEFSAAYKAKDRLRAEFDSLNYLRQKPIHQDAFYDYALAVARKRIKSDPSDAIATELLDREQARVRARQFGAAPGIAILGFNIPKWYYVGREILNHPDEKTLKNAALFIAEYADKKAERKEEVVKFLSDLLPKLSEEQRGNFLKELPTFQEIAPEVYAVLEHSNLLTTDIYLELMTYTSEPALKEQICNRLIKNLLYISKDNPTKEEKLEKLLQTYDSLIEENRRADASALKNTIKTLSTQKASFLGMALNAEEISLLNAADLKLLSDHSSNTVKQQIENFYAHNISKAEIDHTLQSYLNRLPQDKRIDFQKGPLARFKQVAEELPNYLTLETVKVKNVETRVPKDVEGLIKNIKKEIAKAEDKKDIARMHIGALGKYCALQPDAQPAVRMVLSELLQSSDTQSVATAMVAERREFPVGFFTPDLILPIFKNYPAVSIGTFTDALSDDDKSLVARGMVDKKSDFLQAFLDSPEVMKFIIENYKLPTYIEALVNTFSKDKLNQKTILALLKNYPVDARFKSILDQMPPELKKETARKLTNIEPKRPITAELIDFVAANYPGERFSQPVKGAFLDYAAKGGERGNLSRIEDKLPDGHKSAAYFVNCALDPAAFEALSQKSLSLFSKDLFSYEPVDHKGEFHIEGENLVITNYTGYVVNKANEPTDHYVGVKYQIKIPLDQVPHQVEMRNLDPDQIQIEGNATISHFVRDKNELIPFFEGEKPELPLVRPVKISAKDQIAARARLRVLAEKCLVQHLDFKAQFDAIYRSLNSEEQKIYLTALINDTRLPPECFTEDFLEFIYENYTGAHIFKTPIVNSRTLETIAITPIQGNILYYASSLKDANRQMVQDFERTDFNLMGEEFDRRRRTVSAEAYAAQIMNTIREQLPPEARHADYFIGCSLTQGAIGDLMVDLNKKILRGIPMTPFGYSEIDGTIRGEVSIENGELIILREAGFTFKKEGNDTDNHVGVKIKIAIPLDKIPTEAELRSLKPDSDRFKEIMSYMHGEAVISPTVHDKKDLDLFFGRGERILTEVKKGILYNQEERVAQAIANFAAFSRANLAQAQRLYTQIYRSLSHEGQIALARAVDRVRDDFPADFFLTGA